MKKILAVGVICKDNINELRRTLLSISAQTENAHEIIIVDGSKTPINKKSSNIEDIIKKLKEKKVSINYLIQKGDGIASAFNYVYQNSSSKYLLYLNSGDEFFSTDTIKNILPFLEENKSLYCFGSLVCNPSKNSIKLAKPSKKIFDIYFKNPFPHPGVIIEIKTLNKVGGFNEELKQCMDYELFIRLLLKYKIKPRIINLVVSIFYVGGTSTNLPSLRKGMKRSWELHNQEHYYPNVFFRIMFNLRVILYSIIFNMKIF